MLFLARDLGHEAGDLLRLPALEDHGGHRALAEACLLAVGRRRALEAPVGDRVKHELRRRLDRVEVRPDLPDRIGGGKRVADGAVLAEQLAP